MQCIRPDWPAPSNIHALTTTRLGGHSEGVYASNNLGLYTQESVRSVLHNRADLIPHFGLPHAPVWLQQVHSAHCLDLDRPNTHYVADASMTRQKEVVCAILTADCLPIILCNRQGTFVAALHAGWRGLARGILTRVIHRSGERPDDLLAWIGPAISAKHYEVGADVKHAFEQLAPNLTPAFTAQPDPNKWLADLPQIARVLLSQAGVTEIYGANQCTFSDNDLFYSYRRDGPTGRMATLIWRQ